TLRVEYDTISERRRRDLADPRAQFTRHEAHALGAYDVHYQMANPVRVLTSGIESLADAPFYASGKQRFTKREPWWPDYHDPIPVVFGHFWRRWDPRSHSRFNQGEELLFIEPLHDAVMPDHVNAFCVDFSVGIRFKERQNGGDRPYHARLAALRWPEREVVFDDVDPERYPP
ncbi:MAG: hypothetical protein U1F14_07760, partial [Steroidobacteraceae bacterium]